MAARFYKFLGQNSSPSCTLTNVVESKYFTLIMLVVIVTNTIVMIFETYEVYYQKYHSFFLLCERIYLCIYIIECCLKIWVGKKIYLRGCKETIDMNYFALCGKTLNGKKIQSLFLH